jgi:hypothetical protein
MATYPALQTGQTTVPLTTGNVPTDDERKHRTFSDIYDPFANQIHTNYQQPEAYKGVVQKYEVVVLGLILDDRYDVWFNILPLRYLEGDNIEWNIWNLSVPDLDNVPYEGPVSFTSSSKSRGHASLERKGKGFRMEVGYFNSQEGQIFFRYQLQVIAAAVKRWLAYDTVYAITNANNYASLMRMRYGSLPVSVTQIMDNEITSFASLSKKWKDVKMIVDGAKNVLSKNDVAADTFIIPQEVAPFMKYNHDENLLFADAGPDGPKKFNSDELLGTYDGLFVVQANFSPLYGEVKNLPNPLEGRKQIGEYHEQLVGDCDSILSSYSSKEMDIYIYNQDVDDFEKLKYKNSMMHTATWNIHGTGFDKDVVSFIERDRETKKVPPHDALYKTNDELAYETVKKFYGKDPLPHSMATLDDSNKWTPAKYFGHLMPYTTGKKHFRRMAESVLCQIMDPCDLAKYNGHFSDWLNVIEGMQKQGYNEAYFLELNRANITRQLDSNGTFVGEMTPNFVSELRGSHKQIPEWKPTVHGALELPQIDLSDDRFRGVSYPAGFQHGVGLVALEAERTKEKSPWKLLGEKIAPAMKILRPIAETIKTIFPESLAIRDDSRQPWFHIADPLAIFIDNCLPLNADPAFLSDVRMSTERGQNSELIVEDKNSIYYTPLPISDLNGVSDYNEIKKTLKDDYGAFAKEILKIDGTNVSLLVWKNPITNKEIVMNPSLLGSMGSLPPYLQVYAFIGSATALIYADILRSLPLGVDFEMLNKFADRLIGMTSTSTFKKRILAIIKAILAKIKAGTSAADILSEIAALPKDRVKPFFSELTKDESTAEDTSAPRFTGEMLTTLVKNAKGLDPSVVKKLRDLELAYDRLSQLTTKPKHALPPLDLSSKKGIESFAAALDANHFDNVIEATSLINDIKDAMKEVKTGLPETINTVSVKAATTEAKYSSVYHRAPLVFSLALLESIQTLPAPLVKPGDPKKQFLVPVEFSNTNGGKLDGSLWKRSPYLTISQIAARPYHQDNLRYLHGVTEKQPKPSTKPQKITPSVNSFFEGHDDMNESTTKRKRETIGSVANTYDNTLGGVDTLEGFKRRKNNAAFYGTNDNSEILSEVMKFNFERVEEFPHIVRMVAHALLVMRIDDWGIISRLIDRNIFLPLGVVNWRPFMTHALLSGVVMKRGEDTGVTVYNSGNLMPSTQGDIKVFTVNFTMKAKSVVRKGQNIFLLEELVPSKFLGGCNTSYIRNKRDIDEMYQEGRSVVCTLSPAFETKLPKHSSLEGFLPVNELNPRLDKQNMEAHYFNWAFYDEKYKFSSRSRSNFSMSTFSEVNERTNVVCQAGCMFSYNREHKLYDVYRPSKGHRGENGNGRGCAQVWNGQIRKLPDFDVRVYTLT